MEKLIPQKLMQGDEVRIVAPARGLKIIGQESRDLACRRFAEMGLKLSFGKNTIDENWDMFGSTDVAKRVEDLNEAFGDKNVKAIFTVIGGSNSNQLLPYLGYEIIRENPKIFCGFSDITALLTGIYAKTGVVTFSGPHFSSLGMKKGAEYTLENLKKMLLESGENEIQPSTEWSDDLWFLDQENRTFIKNEGWWVIAPGKAEGTIVGGNLGTFDLLLGSAFRPAFVKNTILFVEECFNSSATDVGIFECNLQALLYQEDFRNVSALVIGRFQNAAGMTREKLEYIIKSKKALQNIPVLANVDFGHTTPLLTLPIGGKCCLDTDSRRLFVKI